MNLNTFYIKPYIVFRRKLDFPLTHGSDRVAQIELHRCDGTNQGAAASNATISLAAHTLPLTQHYFIVINI